MIDVQQLYKDQIAFYKGKEHKAWLSISPELRVQIPEPLGNSAVKHDGGYGSYNRKVRKITKAWIEILGINVLETAVDHIVPVAYGFRLGIPPHLVGGLQNLQLLTKEHNSRKSANILPEAVVLCKVWGFSPIALEGNVYRLIKYLH